MSSQKNSNPKNRTKIKLLEDEIPKTHKIKQVGKETLLLKDDSSVTSYTNKIPIAPR